MNKFGITDAHPWTIGGLKQHILQQGGKTGDFFKHVLQQYRLNTGSPDYSLRMNIYNSQKFELSDNTTINFNTSTNTPPKITDVSFAPESENFDFKGGGKLVQTGNELINQKILIRNQSGIQ